MPGTQGMPMVNPAGDPNERITAADWTGERPDTLDNIERAESGLDADIGNRDRKLALETKRRRRGNRVVIAVVLALILGGYLFTFIQTRDLVSDRALNSAIVALEKTNEQRRAVGLPPVDVGQAARDLESGATTEADVASLNTISKLQTDPRLRNLPQMIGVAGPNGAPCLSSDPECVGPQGQQGIPGIPGDAGAQGEPGVDGDPGTPGVQGDPGAQGEQGIQGQQGIPGTPGAPGRGIESGETQGCSIVLTYTDGTSDTFGPFCQEPDQPAAEPTEEPPPTE